MPKKVYISAMKNTRNLCMDFFRHIAYNDKVTNIFGTVMIFGTASHRRRKAKGASDSL